VRFWLFFFDADFADFAVFCHEKAQKAQKINRRGHRGHRGFSASLVFLAGFACKVNFVAKYLPASTGQLEAAHL